MLESRAPIVVFAPPSNASDTECREYFLDGTIRSRTQSTNADKKNIQSGSCASLKMPATAAAALGGSGQQRAPVDRNVDREMNVQHKEITKNKSRRLRSSSPTFIVQQDNGEEVDKPAASAAKRRRIDNTDRRDISAEKDIPYSPLPQLHFAHSNQPIVVPLQLSLSYSLMPARPFSSTGFGAFSFDQHPQPSHNPDVSALLPGSVHHTTHTWLSTMAMNSPLFLS